MDNIESLLSKKQTKIGISQETSNNLREIGRWSKFLSSLGFFYIFLFLAIGLLNVFLTARSNLVNLFFIYLISVLPLIVLAIPLIYLYKFSDNLSKGIKSNSSVFYTEAFRYFKSYYRYIGGVTLLLLIVYLLLFCFAIATSISQNFS